MLTLRLKHGARQLVLSVCVLLGVEPIVTQDRVPVGASHR